MDRKVDRYLELLFKWNAAFALTAFSGREEALTMGVAPSLLAAPLLPYGARVLDVGSGGGFPAIPLAIARPDLHLTLTEPSHPKAAFLREAARDLGLTYRVESRTAEAVLAADQEPWCAVTVRGVHVRKGLLKRLVRALIPGGILIAWPAGLRADQYAEWMEKLGLEVEKRPLLAEPLTLLIGHVPRGTSESNPLE